MALQFKCPQCSTNLIFDASAGKFHCSRCGSGYPIQDYQKLEKKNKTIYRLAEYQDEEVRPYHCRTCKATLIADNRSVIDVCPFCYAPMYLSKRIAGKPSPTMVIPFTITRNQAEKALRKWHRRLKFAKSDIGLDTKRPNPIGIFIPVQLFSADVQGEAKIETTKVTTAGEAKASPIPDKDHVQTAASSAATAETKNRINTSAPKQKKGKEISTWQLYRQAKLHFEAYPINVSQKLDEKLFTAIQPYNTSALTYYLPDSLANFCSEPCTASGKEVLPELEKQLRACLDTYILDAVKEYDTKEIIGRDYQVLTRSCDYTLFPVWIASYNSNDTDYFFVMNGQTGKLAGNPPLSRFKIELTGFLIIIVLFLLMRIITFFLGGSLL